MKKIILSAILALFVVPTFAGAATANITQLIITTSPQTIFADSTSAVMTVNTQNVSNASESLDTSGTTIILNSSSPTGEFSSSNTNWIPVSSLGMNNTTATRGFYYKDATPGTYTITITAEGPDGQTAWTIAIQTITITPAPSATIVGGATYATIQEAITNATSGSTINVGPGTYTGTLNFGGKTLTIVGAGIGVTILDASASTGYAVQGFGDSSAVSGLTLKGTSDNYGFKVSGVSGITLENIKVENSKKTGVDLNGVNGATLTSVEVAGTISGFGINMVDSRNITLTDITTSGNAWGGVSVQTEGYHYPGGADSIIFAGTFNASEDRPLLLEEDPCHANGGGGGCVQGDYVGITNVQVPGDFDYIFYGIRNSSTEKYKQWYYKETADGAKSLAEALMGTFTYSGALIYDVTEANYYVVEGMGIQDAINKATSGDTINVGAGTYAESVVVNKSLRLSGMAGAVIAGNSTDNYVLKIDGVTNVTVDGIEINGQTNIPTTNGYFYGVWVNDSGTSSSPIELKNLIVKNIWSSAGANGIEIDATSVGGSYVLVHNNIISSFQKRGIRFINSKGKVYNNEVIGDDVDGTSRVQNLVNLWGGSTVEIYGNNLHNALTTGSTPTWDSPAIFVTAFGGDGASQADIHDNEIYHSDTGVVMGSVYTGQMGIDPVATNTTDDSTATITNNDFHDLNTGVNFEVTTSSATINGNSFVDAVKGINNNDEASGQIVDASLNWWGVANPNFSTLVSGNVATSPWYADAAMTTLSSEVKETASEKSTVFSAETAYSSDTVSMTIPEGTTITGPLTWDGVFNLPEVTTTYTIPSESNGFWYKPTLAIEMGAEGAALTFDKPVKLTFTGQAGKSAGWSQNGTFHKITSTCTSATAPALEAGADCKIDIGSDLLVWTRHATAFIAFAEEAIPYGGGGGNSASSVVVPTTPASQVAQTAVANTPNTTGQVLGTTISEQASGKSQGKVLGASTASFARDMSVGMRGEDIGELQKMLIAEGLLSGEATNYFGSLTKAALAEWQKNKGLPATGYFGSMTRKALSENESPKPTVRGANTFNFSKNLRFGFRGAEVTELQKILIAEGYLKITTATDYFGPMTKAALVQWQKDNNLPATGFFGPMSREAMLR